MRIGIIDADLISRSSHRFPNLACMKLSGFYKNKACLTELILDYGDIEQFDQVFLSKVFTDTDVPTAVLSMKNVFYGGTGFYFDQAAPLPIEVEHHMPDYGLYETFAGERIHTGEKKERYKFYTDYSIGFLTRGCFRGCRFCVNKNSKKSEPASRLVEFLNRDKKKLCFLDDNFFACEQWESILEDVLETGKRFQFRQGLDLRIMHKHQMKKLFQGKMDGNVIFAFDDIADKEIIERRLDLLYETVSILNKTLKFYVLCGFDRCGLWDQEFWINDIRGIFERIWILMRYGCLAYIMRYEMCWKSPYRGVYIIISRWCNQPAQYSKKSLREFCESEGEQSSSYRYLTEFVKKHPELSFYFEMKYEEVLNGAVHG